MHPSLVIINNTIQLLPCFPALLSYYAYNIIICDLVGKKVKASHTRYRTLGLELIAGVQAVSPQVTISHPPGGRLPLPSARPAVTFPATEHHRQLAGTKIYCLVTEAHRC